MIWLPEMSRDVTEQSSINWNHTKTRINIQHRKQIIENKFQQAEHLLNIHLQQPYPFYWQVENNNCMSHFMNVISNALVIVVENSLYYFHTHFEEKKILLQYDMNDAYLVKSFYDLNHTEEQVFIHYSLYFLILLFFHSFSILISTAQKIWRTNLKFGKRAICQNEKIHSMLNNQITVERINFNQHNQLFLIEPFIPSMRIIIKARLTNMEQRAQ